jgi:hypothetical protein
MINLYNYIEDPSSLPMYETKFAHAIDCLNNRGSWGLRISAEDLEPAKYIIEKTPKLSSHYARVFLRGRWLEAEPYILKSPEYSFYYARFVIQGRWEEAESMLMKDPVEAFRYSQSVLRQDPNWPHLRGQWPDGEPAIMTDPWCAYVYADEALKHRWREAEPYIQKNSEYWALYKARFDIE